jgi:hypothetical protein
MTRIRIGRRFMEKISAELTQSASHAARGKWEAARDCYITSEQMIDTFLQETGLGAYLDGNTVGPPVREPDQESEGDSTPDREREDDADTDVRDAEAEAKPVVQNKRKKRSTKTRATKSDKA